MDTTTSNITIPALAIPALTISTTLIILITNALPLAIYLKSHALVTSGQVSLVRQRQKRTNTTSLSAITIQVPRNFTSYWNRLIGKELGAGADRTPKKSGRGSSAKTRASK